MPLIGRLADDRDLFWLGLGKKIDPTQSLERIDQHGKYLFSTASIVGTLLTGFGIWSGTVDPEREPLLILPLVFIATSLALAMMGITPQLDRVDPTNIVSIREHYAKLLRTRGRFVRIAGILFAIGLVTTPIVFTYRRGAGPTNPTISAQLTDTDARTSLAVKCEVDTLPLDAKVRILVSGTKSGETQGTALAEYNGPATGKASFAVDVPRIDEYARLLVESDAMRSTGQLLRHDVLVLTPPGAQSAAKVAPISAAPTRSTVQTKRPRPPMQSGKCIDEKRQQ